MAEDRRRSSQRGVMTPVFVAVRLKPLGVGRSDSMREAAGCAGKRVERYDDTTITMDGCTFGFPRVVVGPDVEQAESYQLLLPHLLSAWLEGFDVNFLAFGQTGSGKTHTIFGPPGSMQFAAKDAEEARGASGESLTRAPYGVLPRAGLAAMDFLAERGDGVLSGSMIELHFDTVFDLLNDHAPCSINDDHEVQGAKQVPLDSATDLLRLAAQVEQRTTNATRMNDTSSRSHCVTTFTLTRKAGDGKVIVSRFRFVDLAGSERAEEAHDPGVSVKSHVSGWEGITTNYSLSQFKLCAQRAYAISLGRKEHVPFRDCNLTRLLHGSLVGSALTGLVITLSQSARNGGQSWLSLDFGRDIVRLRNRTKPQTAHDLRLLRQRAQAEFDENRSMVEKLSGGPSKKYLIKRQAQMRQWADVLSNLDRLIALGGAA